MKIRPAVKEDWDAIVGLGVLQDYPFPDFNNIIRVAVIEDEDGNIVAAGFIKRFVEAAFMPDNTKPKKVIVESLKLLQDFGIETAKELGIDQLHSFVWHEGFDEILKKHFNYSECRGKALFLDVNNG